MSFELCNENIQIYKPLKTSVVKSIVDSDIIVPDVKPDILNILQVNAVSSIGEKYVQKDMLTLSGHIDYTVLYSGGDDTVEVKNIRYKAPFSQQIEAKGIDNDMFNYVIAEVSHIEYNIENSRKIKIKSVISFDTGIIGKTSVNAVSSIKSSVNIPVKEEEIKLLNMSVCQETKFSVSDEIKIHDGESDDVEILKADCKIQSYELKSMNNKIIAKGSLSADILFKIDQDISHIENEIPFTEVIDVDNLNPNMHTDIKYNLCSADYELINADNEYIVNFTGEISALIRGYEESSYDIVTDTYSPDYELNIKKDNYSVLTIKDSQKDSFSVNESILLKESYPQVLKVYNLDVNPVIETATPQKGFGIIEGYLDTKLLYLSSNDNLPVYSSCNKIPFSFKIENETIDAQSILDTNIALDHSGYIIRTDREIEIRASVKTDTKVLSEKNKSIISDIVLDEETPLKKENQSGITIYFCDEGEKLWDVAKRYRTTIDEIAKINSIDENIMLKKNQKLIIPKRVLI